MFDPIEPEETENIYHAEFVDSSDFESAESILAGLEIDLSFEAHGDATSHGCKMCGNEWKSLNASGYCSSCWQVWTS